MLRNGLVYRHFGGFRLGLAALVMMQHFGADVAPEPLARMLAPYAFGNIAVLVFFALSGFVITEAVDCIYRNRTRAFLGNRLLRIMPHFLVAVALSMWAHELFRAVDGVRLWRSQSSFPLDAFAPANVATNFVGILPLADRVIDYNFLDISWAVRVEMAFYLIMTACIAVGGRLPMKRGYALVAGLALVLLLPLFFLALQGRGIAMLAFLPYFAFGSGLYFATVGCRAGWVTLALAAPAMLWQCIARPSVSPVPGAVQPSLLANLMILIALLAMLTVLAFNVFNRGRKTDRWLGNLTYPLYLYHETVLILVLALTVDYSYSAFCAGLIGSVMSAIALMLLIDPLVNRYRDQLRGRRIDPDQTEPGPLPYQPKPWSAADSRS